ncbi:dihydrofolate reductase [Marinoscillum sp. MHG1-6]|uniref:dihydrofolate reductase n=1 Tax=Marinoscillum sp. MHG1-6 TaxID=2959627 RepID=UPI0021581E99|nr:dihydrofolate reductase [Marinoscillum sp. MHG1-6]
MTISMIAAMSANRVIGKNNDLPWHLPDDFKYFKDTTSEHVVIMGRKNFESLPPNFKPLPNRTNIVITRNSNYQAEGAIVVNSLREALEEGVKHNEKEEIFIIGGGEIYHLGLAHADKIYLTEIDKEIEGDTTFPELDKGIWKETSRTHHPVDDRHKYAFDFVIYKK